MPLKGNEVKSKALMLSELTYWQSVVQNAIGCTIGSFLAIGASVLIYWLTIHKANRTAKVALQQEELNRVRAFAVMVVDAKYVVEKQLKHIESYIELLKGQPRRFPKITLVPLGKIQRIVDTITVEETGLAYMRHFPFDNSASEFTQILDYFDYFFSELGGLAELVKMATLNHEARANSYSDLLDELNKLIVANSANNGTSEVIEKVREIRAEYARMRGGSGDIEAAQDKLVWPLFHYLRTVGAEKVREDDFCRNLFYTSSQLIEYYALIPDGYANFQDEMEGIGRNVRSNLQNLEQTASRLL
jgi:hypothetical protein